MRKSLFQDASTRDCRACQLIECKEFITIWNFGIAIDSSIAAGKAQWSGMAGTNAYAFITMNEEFFEDVVINHLCNGCGYEYLYGPDVARTSDKYDDVFLPGVLPVALHRINPTLPQQAIQEAILKIDDVDAGSLEQRNERFNDYLQTGVEVFSMARRSAMTSFICSTSTILRTMTSMW